MIAARLLRNPPATAAPPPPLPVENAQLQVREAAREAAYSQARDEGRRLLANGLQVSTFDMQTWGLQTRVRVRRLWIPAQRPGVLCWGKLASMDKAACCSAHPHGHSPPPRTPPRTGQMHSSEVEFAELQRCEFGFLGSVNFRRHGYPAQPSVCFSLHARATGSHQVRRCGRERGLRG